MNTPKRKYDPEFEKWWDNIGSKVCRLDKPWIVEEAKYVASVAYLDGIRAAAQIVVDVACDTVEALKTVKP